MSQKRLHYLDAIRIMAAFLVIVNHTNSFVFQSHTPATATWILSMAWYYCSKIAVPLFVMVSGATLLQKCDSIGTVLHRVGRIVGVLVLFSYGYFVYDALLHYGLWPRLADFSAFWQEIYPHPITDSFWYLYMYIGLLLFLPIMQKFATHATAKEMRYVIGLCFALEVVLPFITHYLPQFALPPYLTVTTPSVFIGLFLLGRYMSTHAKAKSIGWTAPAFLALLALCVAITYVESLRVSGKYWFMDDRLHPALPTCLMAGLVFWAMKNGYPQQKRWAQEVAHCGKYAFCIYLVQDVLIAHSKTRYIMPMRGILPDMVLVLLWEIGVFVCGFAIAWICTKLPLIRKWI